MLAVPLALQGQAVSVHPVPPGADFSGFWELRYDSLNVPVAELTPQATSHAAERRSAALFALRWCNYAGVPAMMLGPRPISLALNGYELAVSGEMPMVPRHISVVRTAHVNPDIFDPALNGDSIARWDGSSLMVDTTSFNEKGINEIPGGGYRTATSHLVERFRLIDKGEHLEVTSTWTDPAVFAKPHTYRIVYYKAPPGYNAGEAFCDASETSREASILSPVQPQSW